MVTQKTHSLAALVEWSNQAVNNTNGNTADFQTAFRQTLKSGIKKANYPSCEAELAVIDEITDFDVTPLAEQFPNAIAQYMADTGRAINLPAVDDTTAPGTLKAIHKEEQTKTGVNQMGPNKGETYESTTAAHDEYRIKSNNKQFKK